MNMITMESGISPEKILSAVPWGRLLAAAVLIAGSVVVWRLIGGLLGKYVTRKASDTDKNREGTISFVAYDILRFVYFLVIFLTVLQVFDINVTSLIAGLGIASAVAGIAVQDFIKDVVMGIHIMTDHFFEVGDAVIYSGQTGKVIAFNVRTTTYQDLDTGEIVSICNREITKISKAPEWFDIDLGLAYGEDFHRINDTLTAVCLKIGEIAGVKNCVYKGINDFGDSSVTYKIRIWSAPEEKYEIRRGALRILQNDLGEAGIEIPYPQTDVHVDTAGKSAAGPEDGETPR